MQLGLLSQGGGMPFEDFFTYQYVLDMDGVGGTFRTPSLMLGGSIVLQASKFRYWWDIAFEEALVWVRPDLVDLISTIASLKRDAGGARERLALQQAAIEAGAMSPEHAAMCWRQTLPYFPPQNRSEVEAYLASHPWPPSASDLKRSG